MFGCTYASSRMKRNSFYRKSELQLFLLISGCHIGAPKKYTISNNRRVHKKLCKGANNSKTVGHKDRLGQIQLFIY